MRKRLKKKLAIEAGISRAAWWRCRRYPEECRILVFRNAREASINFARIVNQPTERIRFTLGLKDVQ